ncbi:MAG TPA: HAMP domain-containing sensor histidine kinase [Streptosporangiaceae bacterium]|nr:HAMP domain-containing sensor histidine kinase [Streptosporangiaceae bacterium]
MAAPRRPRGLRWRLVVVFLLVAAVSSGALAVASYFLVRDARQQGSLTASAAQAREDLNLAAGVTYAAASQLVQAYEQRGSHAVLVFPGGRSVASDAGVNPPVSPALRALVGRGQLGYLRIDVGGQPYLVLAGQVPGSPAQLYLYFSEQGIAHNLAQLRNILAGAWLGVVLVAALAGHLLARRTLEPVARASEAAKLMAGGRLDTRLPVTAADEFGGWAAAFNEMADALEAKVAALSAARARELRFTANVAHELRTPLAALVAAASLLDDQVGGLPDPARRPAELLIADVGRLRTLVDELMEISRLDAGSEPVQQRQVDVRSLMAALIGARGWRVQVAEHGEPLRLTTDARRLERILANLIANAVEHSGREVLVRTGTDGRDGYIEVTDAGPGIQPEHLPHVFERFYKADSARTSPGSGLGLAIAQENARLLGGDITASSDVARGSVFRLTLPLRPQRPPDDAVSTL